MVFRVNPIAVLVGVPTSERELAPRRDREFFTHSHNSFPASNASCRPLDALRGDVRHQRMALKNQWFGEFFYQSATSDLDIALPVMNSGRIRRPY